MKIALSGTSGTGKSTLAQKVSEKYNIPVIPEFVREVSEEMGITSLRDASPEQTRELQMKVLQRKMDEETKHQSFIADRSTADNLAYFLRWCSRDVPEEICNIYWDLCLSNLKTYDHIIILPWESIPLENDGFRSSKRYYLYEMECLILGILNNENVPYETMPETTLEGRIRYLEKFYQG